MGKVESVSNFVDGLLNQPLKEEVRIVRQSIELLRQPMRRYHGAGPTHLRLAKHKRQNRDIEIHAGNAKHAPGAVGGVTLHRLDDLGRMKLLAFGMEGKLGIQVRAHNLARHTESVGERGSHLHQQPLVEISDRQQFEHFHRVSTGLLQPYFFIL